MKAYSKNVRNVLNKVLPPNVIMAIMKIAEWYYRLKYYPIIIRRNTSDIEAFRQIFIYKDYDVSYPNKKPKLIIDAGANVGYATLFFRKKFPSAKIISIEPAESNFEVLRKNVAHYQNITIIQRGVWGKMGYLKIHDRGSGEWGYITEEVTADEPYDVEVITLDEILEISGAEKIDILKIDVEGAEKNIFSHNYSSWLGKTDMIIIELHDRISSGCSDAFYSAIKKYNFKEYYSGENIVLTKIYK